MGHHTPAGYAWLADVFKIEPAQPFDVVCGVSQLRKTERLNKTQLIELYPRQRVPAATFSGQMTFALKRETLHLEFLARLFRVIDSNLIDQWLAQEPSSTYARRTGFLFEWLTGRCLKFEGVSVGNYIDALSPDLYFVALNALKVPRWRVRNNLPGVREFCPLIVRTDGVNRTMRLDASQAIKKFDVDFGKDLRHQSVDWLACTENWKGVTERMPSGQSCEFTELASSSLERRLLNAHVRKVRRFQSACEMYVDGALNMFDKFNMLVAHYKIMGREFTGVAGLRHAATYLGHIQSGSCPEPFVQYIGPCEEQMQDLTQGLQASIERTTSLRSSGIDTATQPVHSFVRSAIVYFGFLYIRPLEDGNERMANLLLHDTIARDAAMQPFFLLPLSAAISWTPEHRFRYREVLESFSRPFMCRYADAYKFQRDGELVFDAYDDALPAWRYPNLTRHVEYMGDLISDFLEDMLPRTAVHLRDHAVLKAQLKVLVDAPDTLLDELIHSFRINNGRFTKKHIEMLPALEEAPLAAEVANLIQTCSPWYKE